MDGDMPFLCPIPKCGKRFTNEDHLMVHSKTHEMSLALNTEKSSSSPAHPFVDQTPTPTKILKNFEEIGLGLFQELSKNPFDDAYKKALDSEVAPLPGPQTNELNTPTLIMTDSTRHISTSTAGGVTSLFPMAIDRLKSSAESKLRPSPLAAQESGKKRSGGGGDTMASLSSSGLNLSNKNASSSSVMTVTRSKHRELTSQVADSTSTDVPLDMPNNSGDLQDDEDSAFLVATQSITSPHSTTAIISTTSNLGKQPPLSSLSSSSSLSLSTMDKNLKGSDTNKTSSSTTTVTVAPAPRVKTELVAEEMTSPQQQQCTMQVLLQLPNGQTVPISIPATINNPLIVDDKQAQQQQLQQQLQQEQQQQDIKPQVTTLVIPQQQQPPLLQPAPSKSRPTSMSTTSTTTMTLKQRLKAQLQNQVSPTAKSSSSSSSSLSDHQSNSNNHHHHHHISNTTTTTAAAATSAFVPVSLAAVTSAAGAGSVVQMIPSSNHATVVTAPAPAQSPQQQQQQLTQMYFTQASSTSPIMMMLDSPGSEVNMSDSSEYSFDSKRQKLSPDCEDPEERRRKFLERNRAAAARCRQKRKHWIGNLERKADDLQNTNLRLQNDVKLLRGEVAHLKTLLLAHKDCPVTQQQRSSGQLHQVILTDNPTAFSNQELAQVVPTGGDTLTSEPIQIGQSATIMTFLSDRSGGGARGATGLSENGKDD